MNKQALVAGVKSRAFGILCYSVFAGLSLLYVYTKFIRKNPYQELNVSCFAYRDDNRNGVYDLEDRPYAGLRILLRRPKGGEVSAVSNLAGFTNFPMSRAGGSAMIRTPGQYTMEAVPPSGWTITSSNAIQAVDFKRLDGSPSGIVAGQTFTPVGIAPNLVITGRVKPAGSGKQRGELRSISPRGDVRMVTVDEAGLYSMMAEPGVWRIDYAAPGGKTISRAVVVKGFPIVLSTLDPEAVGFDQRRTARKVDFDTLTVSDTLYEIPNGYGGLNWTNWVATHHKLYNGAGYVNAAVSSEYVAYNSSGHPASVWSTQPFDFASAHITAAWPNAEKHDVVIKAWRGSELLHHDRIRIRTAGPIYYSANYGNVTRVEFSSDAYWQIVIDDVEYRIDEDGNAGAPSSRTEQGYLSN